MDEYVLLPYIHTICHSCSRYLYTFLYTCISLTHSLYLSHCLKHEQTLSLPKDTHKHTRSLSHSLLLSPSLSHTPTLSHTPNLSLSLSLSSGYSFRWDHDSVLFPGWILTQPWLTPEGMSSRGIISVRSVRNKLEVILIVVSVIV